MRRRRRRRKYGTEHPQALHVVHVDSNGQASGATKEKEQKNGIGNEIKRPEEDDGKNVKEHGEKDGFKNGGYESDGKDKVSKPAANYGLSRCYYVRSQLT